MKDPFNEISIHTSRIVTKKYSTSFSAGIKCIKRKLRDPIYSIYAFVRFADEIVDSFHLYNRVELLNRFKEDTNLAIINEISLNPILNSFQKTVNKCHIDKELIDEFFYSMEMDLIRTTHDEKSYEKYIKGSAEAVGLMCLSVFCEGSQLLYDTLTPKARRMGAAYQKVNFLRDINYDYKTLGRVYFPNTEIEKFNTVNKKLIEKDIKEDFMEGYIGIKKLSGSSRLGVYLSYKYSYCLFKKIKRKNVNVILNKRIRLSNFRKITIAIFSIIRNLLGLI